MSSAIGIKRVNYPPYSLTADAVRSLRMGLPVSTTRFADTGVSIGIAVSAGVNESHGDSFSHQKSKISGDIDSEYPTPTASRPMKNIPRCVRVSIRLEPTRWTGMFPNPQRFIRLDTTGRALLRRIFRVNCDEVRSFALTLVFEHPQERPPRRSSLVPRDPVVRPVPSRLSLQQPPSRTLGRSSSTT